VRGVLYCLARKKKTKRKPWGWTAGSPGMRLARSVGRALSPRLLTACTLLAVPTRAGFVRPRSIGLFAAMSSQLSTTASVRLAATPESASRPCPTCSPALQSPSARPHVSGARAPMRRYALRTSAALPAALCQPPCLAQQPSSRVLAGRVWRHHPLPARRHDGRR
jgi:hypothetical protein